ncbi:MAG TPA: ABC transporter substrate-binding protein [Stellaceae bacterium]|nr:ABC transporter substrate-binding protein [Stellaceae bacterium]
MKRLLATAVVALGAMTGAAAAETTLVVAMQADPTGLDPEAVLNNTSGFVMATIYDSLVKFKPGTTDVEPGLAEKWDISPDGLTYTFHLKKGVKFHDGTPFNAEAYVHDLNRWLKKDDPDSIYKTGPVEGYLDDTFDPLDSYRAVDEYTVEMKLKHPYAPFLTNLAMVWNGITSPAATQKLGKDFRSNPVGTGPFIFKEWKRGDQVVLTANKSYWNGKPKVDRLIFKVMPDPQASLLALKRGDVHILADVSAQIIPAMKQDKNIVVMTQPGLAVSGVGLPFDTKPFNDKRVRQALNYAIDKDAIDKSLFRGLAVRMTSPLPEAQWGFDKSLKGYPYDPKKAKELLAAAGYPNGFESELLTYNSARGYNSAGAELAVAIQGQLEKIGVKTSVRKEEIGAYLSEIRSKTKPYSGMFLVGWTGDNGDPDNFLDELFASDRIPVTNTVRYKNPEVDKVLAEAQRESDHAKRVALYHTAQKEILDDAPWIFINSLLQVRGARKEVKGYELNPTQMFFDMEKVSLSK